MSTTVVDVADPKWSKARNPFEAAWVSFNPRPYWTSAAFWEACRPDHEKENDGKD